jgi:outer membrane protein assembly factor BamB
MLLVALILLALIDAEAVWPGFLGAGASDVDPTSIPAQWAPGKNIAWQKTLIGHGQSSPVVYGDRVFVTSCDGPNKENLHVTCVRLGDGKTLWDKKLSSTNPEKNSLYVSRAAPTPLVDSEHVYAYFESGDVFALNRSGVVVWKKSLTKMYAKPINVFGLSASPVQWKDRIVLLIDDKKSQGRPGAAPASGEAKSYIVALNKADGETIWKQDRSNRTSWSSPAIVPVGDKSVVVCSSAGSVDGYSPKDGKLLFSFTDVSGNTSTTPIPVGNGKFLVAASPGRGEGGEAADLAKRSNGLMQITEENGKWKAEFLWRNSKVSPSFGSPIVYSGYAYWLNRAGAVYCVNATNGETAYSGRLVAAWATPIGIGDRIYFFSQKNGTTNVIAAGPEFKILGTNKLWDKEPADDSLKSAGSESAGPGRGTSGGQTIYGAAVVSGNLLIRTGNTLFCVRK